MVLTINFNSTNKLAFREFEVVQKNMIMKVSYDTIIYGKY